MTDKEKIIAEIERLKKELYKQRDFRIDGSPIPVYDTNAIDGMLKVLDEVKGFINSLPAEQPSEELEEEIKLYQLRNPVINHQEKSLNDLIKRVAIYFANWQKEQIINKASQWLNENVVEYHPRKGELRPIVNINAFRDAMEKEDEQ